MKILLITTLLWTITACSVPESEKPFTIPEVEESVLPTNWKRIKECSTMFYIPSELEEKKPYYAAHSSGCIKVYGNENIWLNFARHSTTINIADSSSQRDFQLDKTLIDGKQAEISTFTGTDMVNEAQGKNYVAFMYVLRIRNEESIYMWAYSKSLEDRENVIKVFKSVQFLKD